MRDGFVCFDRGDLLRVMEARCIGMEGHGMAWLMPWGSMHMGWMDVLCAGACPMSWLGGGGHWTGRPEDEGHGAAAQPQERS